jgi:hypothetical protein
MEWFPAATHCLVSEPRAIFNVVSELHSIACRLRSTFVVSPLKPIHAIVRLINLADPHNNGVDVIKLGSGCLVYSSSNANINTSC